MDSLPDISSAEALTAGSLFQNAFEFAAIGMALVSPEGKWLCVNRSVCDITGYSEAELLERTFQDITHPDDLDLDLANVKKMLAGKIKTYQMEKRYIPQERLHRVGNAERVARAQQIGCAAFFYRANPGHHATRAKR
jgi:PAS domain S-box-containing protein